MRVDFGTLIALLRTFILYEIKNCTLIKSFLNMLCSMCWLPLAVLLGDETKTNYSTAVAVVC